MFLPTTRAEMSALGWDELDIILITGDSYIDSPFIGAAVIGKVLLHAGYRVGVIAQPDVESDRDICRLGEPRLFWGVTGGSIDSMVANYTAARKKRKSDDYTPGGINDRRPDRAVIAYSNLIRRYFKDTVPIVLGGIEASLRRVAHYDFWSDKIRRSILFDAKADYLLYGMAERSVRELAECLDGGMPVQDVRGLCYISREKVEGYLELPPLETVQKDKDAFTQMFNAFYQNNDPLNARGLLQLQDTRYLVQNPPAQHLSQEELDAVYDLGYERLQHPYYEKMGAVKALETIRFSVSTHRGCYGECNFCAIAVHEGRRVRWRSRASILREIELLTQQNDFKGYIHDVGGPTANMYGFECTLKSTKGSCKHKRCLYPTICPELPVDHQEQIYLLRAIRKIGGIKKAFVASGIRYDLLLHDKRSGSDYLKMVIEHHTSGQMKVAPEHTQAQVLKYMGKPSSDLLLQFRELFFKLAATLGKNYFLTYYLIAAHPGCGNVEMENMKRFVSKKLHIHPEQIQIFTPSPSTYSSLMYYTGKDPFTGEEVFVEKDLKKKELQKEIIIGRKAE